MSPLDRIQIPPPHTTLLKMHFLFQFLNKTYIEKRTKMLSVDQMRKNQVALRKGQKIGVAAKASKDETIANQSSKDSIATRRSVRSAIARLETLGPSARYTLQ